MKKRNRYGPPFQVGERIRHESGCTIQIVSGQFMVDDRGQSRVSNFWYWRRVRRDGTLGQLGHGYGLLNKKGELTGGEWERVYRFGKRRKTDPKTIGDAVKRHLKAIAEGNYDTAEVARDFLELTVDPRAVTAGTLYVAALELLEEAVETVRLLMVNRYGMDVATSRGVDLLNCFGRRAHASEGRRPRKTKKDKTRARSPE